MEQIREQLRSLTEALDHVEEAKTHRCSQLEHVERCVGVARHWPTESVPLSKESTVRELGDRVLPALEAVLEVLRDQQSRIEVLELAVVERQQRALSCSVSVLSDAS